jgi:glycosyltransferase involved in cell wall biosynthesis
MNSIDQLRYITIIGQASLEDTHGGATRLRTMIDFFRSIGLSVNLITYSFYSDHYGVEKKNIDTDFYATTIHVPNNLPKLIKGFSVITMLKYAWKPAKRGDLLFTNFRCVISSIPTIILSKIFNKPVISDYLDIDPLIPDAIYRYVAQNSDIIFAISPQLTQKAKAYGCKNAYYISNFVDVERFRVFDEKRNQRRVELGIKNQDIVIGYAGSFWFVEGIPVLMDAFNELKNTYPNIKLAIMGGVNSTDIDTDVEKLVKEMGLEDRVILIPRQKGADVPEFLSAFDILCCPKINCDVNRLIIPVKIIEYLSMGLPTIASAVGGICDVICDKQDGLLVAPGDVESLKNAIEWVLLNPTKAEVIGKNGRKTAIDYYSLEAIDNMIKQAIEQLELKNK